MTSNLIVIILLIVLIGDGFRTGNQLVIGLNEIIKNQKEIIKSLNEKDNK